MTNEKRISELEKEIENFECLQLKKQRELQNVQERFQQEFAEIAQAILTRKGGIIELNKLQEEENNDSDST